MFGHILLHSGVHNDVCKQGAGDTRTWKRLERRAKLSRTRFQKWTIIYCPGRMFLPVAIVLDRPFRAASQIAPPLHQARVLQP